MTLEEFIWVLKEIEDGRNPKVEYNLHDALRMVFITFTKPSEFFESVLSAESPSIEVLKDIKNDLK